MLHAVVMAGGSGTRFWPQSRRDRPKQLLRLAGPESMLQATVDRVADLIPAENTWIVTGERLADETRRQLPQVSEGNVLIEPCGRNTAPCVGLAALALLRSDADAVMLVMPADHVIQPAAAFREAVSRAVETVMGDPERLVLFGVTPSYAATGYGYIEREGDGSAPEPHRVARFREKPDAATAAQYVASRRFYWNCGIFVWGAETIVRLLERFEPEMMARLRRIIDAAETPEARAVLADEFPQVKAISIDYAVLERAENVVVLPATFDWDDVGSWRSLERLLGQDADGNAVDGPFVGLGARSCIVRTTEDHLVTAIGVEDLIIVHTPDATLVAKKSDENAVRQLVELLERKGLDRFL